jgi:4Fe-4S ferredoxin
LIEITSGLKSEKTQDKQDIIEKSLDLSLDQLVLNWQYKDVKKKLTYDIKKCVGCSLCKLVCPVDAIELGPIPEIAQNILDDSNPKLFIDHDKCCYCMLCVVVCPTDAFHENIEPEGQIVMDEFPTIEKFYEIDFDKCTEDKKNEICQLCLAVRERNLIQDYFKISKECPADCFSIATPIEGEVIIKKNMLHKCDPQGCKACVNICPVESFYIPESAEEVVKYGKIACNEDECFYCGACENSCPDDLIVVKRKNIQIRDPKKSGPYPWIEGWVNNIKEVLRKALIEGKEQVEIPSIEEHVKKITELKIEEVPQLSEEDKLKLKELNGKIQSLLQSSKIRYWIKDKKVDSILKELKKKIQN